MHIDSASLAVVANPAGAGDEANTLSRLLDERGLDAQWLETNPEDPGRGQTSAAIERGADLVIACGGDGTVRACLEAAAGTGTRIAIFPAGTGNLLARNLGIPLDHDAAFDVLSAGSSRSIDVGWLNDEAFAVMAGIGIDARIMKDTSREAKDRFGPLAYVAAGLRHLRDRPFSCTVRVDGHTAWEGPASSLLVANHGELPLGVDLFPDASALDGRLDALAVTARSLGDWLAAAWAVVRRTESAAPLHRFEATSLDVQTDRPVPYEVDGDERDPATRFTFSVTPSAVSVLVPPEASA